MGCRDGAETVFFTLQNSDHSLQKKNGEADYFLQGKHSNPGDHFRQLTVLGKHFIGVKIKEKTAPVNIKAVAGQK